MSRSGMLPTATPTTARAVGGLDRQVELAKERALLEGGVQIVEIFERLAGSVHHGQGVSLQPVTAVTASRAGSRAGRGLRAGATAFRLRGDLGGRHSAHGSKLCRGDVA